MYTVKKITSFLNRHTFIPLALASILGLAMYSVRVGYSGTTNYKNLVWNLFLAWLPYLFSLWAARMHIRRPRWVWPLFLPAALWLLFFPNAPYIITDFLHLVEREPIPIWYDILMLATFAWTGVLLGFASLQAMQHIIKDHLGHLCGWIFVAGSLGLGGLGIYLGRFSRWNSWDIFSEPKAVLKDVALPFTNPLGNKEFFGFTMLFAAFLLVGYLAYVSMRGYGESHGLEHE